MRGKLDEERWEHEDVQYAHELATYQAERTDLAARLVPTTYSPAYLTEIEATSTRIATGLQHLTREERRKTYELLNLRIRIAVEAGMKIAYAECELDTERLMLGAQRSIANSCSRSRACAR